MTVFGEIGFLGMLTLVSALQGLFLSAIVGFRHREDGPAALWLSLLILLMSLHLIDMTLAKTSAVQYFAIVSDSSFALLFLIGPVYYAYTRALLGKGHFSPSDLIHLLPALYILWDMLPWLSIDPQFKIDWQAAQASTAHSEISLETYLKLAFNIVQNLAYLSLSLKLINSCKLDFEAASADGSLSEGMQQLSALTKAFTAWVGCYLVVFIALVVWGRFGEKIDHIWLLINGFFILATGLGALTRPALFTSRLKAVHEAQTPTSGEDSSDHEKYMRSALDKEKSKALKEDFEAYMAKEKPYLEGTLRMPDVAAKLGTSPHYLSQMINQELNDSFLAVVNRYRVEEVIHLMRDPARQKDTNLTLAFEAGFNNKNSFNRSFREFTGKTPSAFRQTKA
ncbi:MAG: AraC family transcriptional regulator [Alphaproteobacteria bacterium]|nr:AraC family transcriptional regulator [Alphaproteobacteria bacterium]